LPAGTHTYAVTFSNCLVDGLAGTTLDGTTSIAYTGADLYHLTAVISVNSMRGKLVAYRSDLYDVTANGSGTWARESTGTPWTTTFVSTTTYTPAAGSTLVNNRTSGVATFEGGSYSGGYGPTPPGAAASAHDEFNDLVIDISGTSYTLNGALRVVYGFSADQNLYMGEVRITSNGSLMARVYGDCSGKLRTEVLSPLVPF
jgi:hypothetical protein